MDPVITTKQALLDLLQEHLGNVKSNNLLSSSAYTTRAALQRELETAIYDFGLSIDLTRLDDQSYLENDLPAILEGIEGQGSLTETESDQDIESLINDLDLETTTQIPTSEKQDQEKSDENRLENLFQKQRQQQKDVAKLHQEALKFFKQVNAHLDQTTLNTLDPLYRRAIGQAIAMGAQDPLSIFQLARKELEVSGITSAETLKRSMAARTIKDSEQEAASKLSQAIKNSPALTKAQKSQKDQLKTSQQIKSIITQNISTQLDDLKKDIAQNAPEKEISKKIAKLKQSARLLDPNSKRLLEIKAVSDIHDPALKGIESDGAQSFKNVIEENIATTGSHQLSPKDKEFLLEKQDTSLSTAIDKISSAPKDFQQIAIEHAQFEALKLAAQNSLTDHFLDTGNNLLGAQQKASSTLDYILLNHSLSPAPLDPQGMSDWLSSVGAPTQTTDTLSPLLHSAHTFYTSPEPKPTLAKTLQSTIAPQNLEGFYAWANESFFTSFPDHIPPSEYVTWITKVKEFSYFITPAQVIQYTQSFPQGTPEAGQQPISFLSNIGFKMPSGFDGLSKILTANDGKFLGKIIGNPTAGSAVSKVMNPTSLLSKLPAGFSSLGTAIRGAPAAGGLLAGASIPASAMAAIAAVVVIAVIGIGFFMSRDNLAEQVAIGGNDMVLNPNPATAPGEKIEGICWPVTSGRITETPDDHEGVRSSHGGSAIDIGIPLNSPLYAPFEGVVTEAGWNDSGYGYRIEMLATHEDRGSFTLIFAHLYSIAVSKGDRIEFDEEGRSPQIGTTGNSGNSTGPHLHYEAIGINIRDIIPFESGTISGQCP